MRETIPTHEAGHAVLQIALGLGCERVTIVPDADSQGAAFHSGEYPEESAELRAGAPGEFWLRHAVAMYAGAEAERQLGAENWLAGAGDDYRNATDAINRITDDGDSIDMLFKLAKRRATLLVRYYWSEITAVAKRLEEARTLTGDQVKETVRASLERRGTPYRDW